ncbi:DUF7674 family protein [Actinopolymorpha alba]|uniref:DUF7674 family protein n=1 Tax=Actinopolymorpha alba TaxID=533267 RepID=UPI0003A08017|nr:hypothetical protein [Actinopolymorpha alba]
MMSQRSKQGLVEGLVEAIPPLRTILDEHRREFGDQAPEAFLRTLAFVAVSHYLSGAPSTGDQLREVLHFLEPRFGTDEQTDELIAASFLAHLPLPDDPRARALELLGPKLRSQLELLRQGKGIPVSSPTADTVQRLVRAVPALEPDLREHVEFYDELLPHLFLGEVSSKLVEWFQSGDPDELAQVRASVVALEAAYGSNYEVDELIGASFVENMPGPGEPGDGIVQHFGPKLRAVLKRQRG